MNRAEALPHYLAKLAEFKEQFGHTNVPRTYEAESALADWVRSVRNAWREGRLHEIHINKLTDADFCFAPLEEAWQTLYEKLVQYVRAYGDAKVPRDYEDHSLAIWVMHQRDHWKVGKLDDDKLKLLKRVKFIFDPQDYQWEENMKRLTKFRTMHGHALVPRRYPDDTKLADFAAEMRQRFKANSLSERQVEDLIAHEFIFDPVDAVWSQKLCEYAEWRATSGDEALPPRRIAREPFPLYEWCRLQLANLKAGKVPVERIARLAKAGFPGLSAA